MKISEAIRIGIKMDGPQIFGSLYEFDVNGKLIGCCAIGAAKIGILGSTSQKDLEYSDSQMLFPEIHDRVNDHDLFTLIADRNDSGCSREAIADWLESIGY